MIAYEDSVFHLTTDQISYVMEVREGQYLENLYFGQKVMDQRFQGRREPFANEYGNVVVDPGKSHITLDNLCLEFSSGATGDFRESALELLMPDGTYSNRFTYQGYKLYPGVFVESTQTGMPYAREASGSKEENIDTLEITFLDQLFQIELRIIYTVFEQSNVITQRRVLKNLGTEGVTVDKFMSLQLDLPERDYYLETFDGAWARERQKNHKELVSGIYINSSTTGNSSNRHNPFILLGRSGSTEHMGECIGINLIYSGNHYEAVEVTEYDKLRILAGINPHRFSYEVKSGESFYTPEAVISFSNQGKSGLSSQMHKFVLNHIVPEKWAYKERPVLINNWEATYFDFNKSKLLHLAKEAKQLGIELFVLDDGWYGNRQDDTSSLGDWVVNEKKLGGTLKELADKINGIGLQFGLWMEPEMISRNSRIYEEHPEYAIEIPGREAYLGRNQLVLDYTKKEVRDYIIESICNVLSSANISYVKWDMNRQITDAYSSDLGHRQGEFYHRYILGLYEVLESITKRFPDILFESCAAGGNRFDLGMSFYMPQTWTSDDTDANERIHIQEGTSYGYPLSTMGAHVSAAPNHQTLRNVNLETRFAVACFGVLGYELDVTKLTRSEKKVITNQIAFYKAHRSLFQFGTFSRSTMHNGNIIWQVVSEDKEEAIALVYQSLSKPNVSSDILKVTGLKKDSMYEIRTRKQFLSIKEFGDLVNQVSPVKISQGGVLQSVVDKVYMLESEEEVHQASGDLLEYGGIKLAQRFIGTGYNNDTRVMGDFSSRLYIIRKL